LDSQARASRDQHALETAFIRAQADHLDFLPLFLDAANPSPDQGWNELERKGLQARAPADALIALAFAHHLAIGRNIPLPQVVAWLCGLAPKGVIEFVRKDDPTVQQMLSLREDIFPDYTEEAFATALQRQGRDEEGGKSSHEQGIDHHFVFTGHKRHQRQGQRQQQVRIIAAVLPSEEGKSLVHDLDDNVIVEKQNQQRNECRHNVGLLRLAEDPPAKHGKHDGDDKRESEEAA